MRGVLDGAAVASGSFGQLLNLLRSEGHGGCRPDEADAMGRGLHGIDNSVLKISEIDSLRRDARKREDGGSRHDSSQVHVVVLTSFSITSQRPFNEIL